MRKLISQSMRAVAPFLGAFALAAAMAPAALADIDSPYGGPGMMWNGGWTGWLFGPVMMIVFLAAIIAVVVLLVRWLGGLSASVGHPTGGASRTALDILKERFARGEIEREELEERKRVLDA